MLHISINVFIHAQIYINKAKLKHFAKLNILFLEIKDLFFGSSFENFPINQKSSKQNQSNLHRQDQRSIDRLVWH
jgi:hypothetical protein